MKNSNEQNLVDRFAYHLEILSERGHREFLIIAFSLFAGGCLGSFALIMLWTEGMHRPFISSVLGGVACLLIPGLLRLDVSAGLAGNALGGVIFLNFAAASLQNGGIGQPATFAAGLVPFIVALTAGWKSSIPWAVATMLGLFGLDWLHDHGHVFPDIAAPDALYLRQFYGTAIVILFMGLCSGAYEWLRQDSIRKLCTRNRELENAHEEQSALSRILQIAVKHKPLDELLHDFLDELLGVSWLDVQNQGAVFLVDGADTLVLAANRNLAKPLLTICSRVPFGACLCGRAAAQRRTQFSSCVDERHEHRFPEMGPHGHYNIPILLGDRLLGVIVIYLEAGRSREEREVLFLESAATIVSNLIMRDISENEKRGMQSELAHSQKLESVGQLAAGVAHEINTPAQYVGDNLEFLDQSFGELGDLLKKYRALHAAAKAGPVPPELITEVSEAAVAADLDFLEEEIPRSLSQSREGIGRVTKIVRAMKDFSHPGSSEKEPIDLNRAIESTVTVASNEWKYVARVEMDFDADLPLVPCLAGEFNQVVLNVVVNAAHALAEVQAGGSDDEKGEIRIVTRREADEWAVVEISDNGPGMPDEVRSKIFDPFFTTKEVGKGTGQGLAIAHSVIVDKHGGTIEVDSEVGNGTTFRIRLPMGERKRGEETI